MMTGIETANTYSVLGARQGKGLQEVPTQIYSTKAHSCKMAKSSFHANSSLLRKKTAVVAAATFANRAARGRWLEYQT